MQKHISAAEVTPVRVVFVTLDSHLASAVERAGHMLRKELPQLEVSLHALSEWGNDADAPERCRQDIECADIIITTMMFMDDHIRQVQPWIEARRNKCDAVMCGMSGGEIMRLTRMGQFAMDAKSSGIIGLLKKMRGAGKNKPTSNGARQMAMLRRIPKILRFIPGKAQDVRAYFIALQYWLAGSDENVANMVRYLITRYAAGPRAHLNGTLKVAEPKDYPDTGLYHPRLPSRITDNLKQLTTVHARKPAGTVGLLIMRSYVLAGNTAHYDGVISALEARGLRVVPAFACGLDSRPAIQQYFQNKGKTTVDAVVSLTGFSLVGGPAYNDAAAASETLSALDVPYVAAQAVEFQSLESWEKSVQGLTPVEATMMVAIPEIDGSTGSLVFGGRSGDVAPAGSRDMQVHNERADMLARRVQRLISLRKSSRAARKVAMVLFNFPPNGGAVGTAAFLSVFASLFNSLKAMQHEGYTVDLPDSVDDLREQLLDGNSARYGTPANVHAHIEVNDHVRNEIHLADIEKQWGAAPGRHQTDGRSIFVLGAQFGNVFVGIQPAFGYEGDPMRLLFEHGFAPTHAFAGFYRWLRESFQADAVVHFGTHGALEFMPGKQTALSAECWPDRLIADLPNFYLYAGNNPSEGTIAKRRSAATLISYQTPPVTHAGLYRGLLELKSSLERWRALTPEANDERGLLMEMIHAQACAIDLVPEGDVWPVNKAVEEIGKLTNTVLEYEYSLIPSGLHVVGEGVSPDERTGLLKAMAEAGHELELSDEAATAIAHGKPLPAGEQIAPDALEALRHANTLLSQDHELPALLHALDAGFIPPAPGGDLIRNPDVLPTGRNMHGFDPMRIPSAFAMKDGESQATRLLARHMEDGNSIPETVALVLWGTDNLKSEGGPIAQALSLLGARPRLDGYGRLCGAELIPLEELGRPRIDVMLTLSGIFRDLLPLQVKLLAEAAFLAGTAEDEAAEQNFVRKHVLAHMAEHDCDVETAALRVFSNAEGAYGSNLNQMIDAGCWNEEDELAETYTRRKCFAYGRSGTPLKSPELLNAVLKNVDLAYQNLESVELGVTTIDHYFDTLGGISRAVKRSSGTDVPVYVSDQTRSEGKVRTISEQIALETRTRTLNPKWYESLLEHGHEGVRNIEAQVTNTVGWSATTGQVQPWIYKQITKTFVLDEDMRRRLAELNPAASTKLANRLIEASERNYWNPDQETLEALRRAGEELEDIMEGISAEAVA
jgi:magnesium chelatase subunit H